VGTWTSDFKATLDKLLADGVLKDYRDHSTESRPSFVVSMASVCIRITFNFSYNIISHDTNDSAIDPHALKNDMDFHNAHRRRKQLRSPRPTSFSRNST
jgi:hypothetical protein